MFTETKYQIMGKIIVFDNIFIMKLLLFVDIFIIKLLLFDIIFKMKFIVNPTCDLLGQCRTNVRMDWFLKSSSERTGNSPTKAF